MVPGLFPLLVNMKKATSAAGRCAPGPRRRKLGRFVDVFVGGGLLALMLNTWLLQGLVVPNLVASGSMTPALVGPHRRWRCEACQHAFVCSAESLGSIGADAVCPNCAAGNDARRGVDVGGDRLFVDRSAFQWRSPRRFEVVVFRSPRDACELCVKRVVGLPGETMQLVDGDVIVDGRRIAKTIDEAHALAVNVHDAPASLERWRTTGDTSWRLNNGRAIYRPRATRPGDQPPPQAAAVDWLSYRHELCLQPGAAPLRGPITDESPCDQMESRMLTSVTDVALACDVQASGDGAVYLRATARGDEFIGQIDVASGQGDLWKNGRVVVRFATAPHSLRSAERLELMLADRQAQLSLAGQLLARWKFEPANNVGRRPDQVLAIGARGAEVEVRRLLVTRDVYYTPSPGGSNVKYRLGPDEYFLLGDNSPHALDSRAWSAGGAGVSREMILGRALPW